MDGVVVKLDCGIDGCKDTRTRQCYPSRDVWASLPSLVVVLMRFEEALSRDIGM